MSDVTQAERATKNDHIATVRGGIQEIWNEMNWEATEKFFAPDIKIHFPTEHGPLLGREAFKPLFTRLTTAFPDIHFTIERLCEQGDHVAGRWTMRGTHTGPFRGLAPTGRKVAVDEFVVFQFEDGLVKELWLMPNLFGLMQQLGAIPPGPPPKPLIMMMRAINRLRGRKPQPAPPSYASQ